jgi:hypothetical protein
MEATAYSIILLVCFCIYMTMMVFILFTPLYTLRRTVRRISKTPPRDREEEFRRWCGRNTVEVPQKEYEVDGVKETEVCEAGLDKMERGDVEVVASALTRMKIK